MIPCDCYPWIFKNLSNMWNICIAMIFPSLRNIGPSEKEGQKNLFFVGDPRISKLPVTWDPMILTLDIQGHLLRFGTWTLQNIPTKHQKHCSPQEVWLDV